MAVKTFEDAIRKMIKEYWAGTEPEASNKAGEVRKFDKKYFDNLGNEHNLPTEKVQ